MALLEVKNLGISFGGLRAVDDFHMEIEQGQLYGLIGPNGAGKTTVFNLLTGVYQPTDSYIMLDGENITGKKTIEINKYGIARYLPEHPSVQRTDGSGQCKGRTAQSSPIFYPDRYPSSAEVL